jgi:hypothetical protein
MFAKGEKVRLQECVLEKKFEVDEVSLFPLVSNTTELTHADHHVNHR